MSTEPGVSAGPVAPNSVAPQWLWGRLAEATALNADGEATAQFNATWLALQCAHILATTHAVLVLGPPDTGPFLPAAFWPEGKAASELLAEVADLALESRQASALQRDGQSAIAYPIMLGANLHGLVALQAPACGEEAALQAMRQLQWGVQGIAAALLREQSTLEQGTRERLMATLDLVASAMTEQKFYAAANSLATDLAVRMNCDRVSIGFRHDTHARVEAVSHSSQIGKRMNLIRDIAAAMDESIDQKSLVRVPINGEQALVTRDHAALARQHGNDCLLTVPFLTSEGIVGAFTFERSGQSAFTNTEVDLCQAVVALCSRILEEKRLNDRRLVTRVANLASEQLARFIGPRHFGRKLVAMMVFGLVIFFSVARTTYTLGAKSVLEGAVRRVLVVPFDGYVETASQRAGDVVKAGTVLVTLDQRDLQLEYLRWASQADQYTNQYQEALAKSDRVQLNVTLTQMQQAQAQMALLAEQLARAAITAPFDGIVVSGDLSQSLGSAVKRGQTLFEIAPLNAYRVILEVDETDIANVRDGQKGELMLTSLPGEVFPLVIGHVTPVTTSREGRSYFRVEASVGKVSERLRPGMEGISKIEVGERLLIWQWTHKMLDWLRLAIWSWI